jgi:phage-related protein
MGFMDFISNIGNKIKEGASRVGQFISEKAAPIIGKISGVARTIGNAINSGPGQAILDGISMLPIPGAGAVAGFIRRGGRLASTIGEVGQTAEKVAGGVGSALQGNLSQVGQTFGQGRQLVSQVQEARGQGPYTGGQAGQNVADRVQGLYSSRNPPPRPAVYRPSPYRR